jgi:hypothetical protein
MSLSVCIVHYLKVDEETMRIWSEILQAEATLLRTIFNHYRPELHYMRGPGPKWLEKPVGITWRSLSKPSLRNQRYRLRLKRRTWRSRVALGLAIPRKTNPTYLPARIGSLGRSAIQRVRRKVEVRSEVFWRWRHSGRPPQDPPRR